jgi:MFS family permease
MSGAYGRILRTPGTARLLGGGLGAWTAGTMMPVAFVLFVTEVTGSFGDAGLVLGALSLGAGLLAPLRGRLIDRRGSARAVLMLAVPAAATDALLILAGRAGLPTAVLAAVAFVSGAVVAPVGTALRTTWSVRMRDAEDRQAAYGLLTAVGEVSFFTGPLIAGLLAAVSPTLAVATAGGLALTGALTFAGAADDTAAKAREPGVGVLGTRGMRVVVVTAALFGLTFGALDVAFPALARERGSTAAAGLLLSAIALGVGACGLTYGGRRSRRTATARYAPLSALAAAGLVPLLALPPLGVMMVLAVLAGACFAPVTVTQNATIDEVAPKAVMAEAFALLGSAYAAGAAAGAAASGSLVQHAGVRPAVALACGATLAAALIAAGGFRGAAGRPGTGASRP